MAASLPPFPTPEAGPAFHPEAGPFYCGIGPVTGGLFSSQRARTSTLLHPRDYPGAGHGGPLLRGRRLTPWTVKSGLAALIVGVGNNHPVAIAVWALVFGTQR